MSFFYLSKLHRDNAGYDNFLDFSIALLYSEESENRLLPIYLCKEGIIQARLKGSKLVYIQEDKTIEILEDIRDNTELFKIYGEKIEAILDKQENLEVYLRMHLITDFERIKESLVSSHEDFSKDVQINIYFDLLKDLPNILRESNNKITITVWKNKTIIACEPGNTVNDNFGIAFDIGTTTVVGYLINLNNGKIYAVASDLNSQTAYGEDLITRLTFIKNKKENLSILNSAVINDLNKILVKTCNEVNIDPSRVYEVSVVGNSVMHHIFLGLDPTYIGLSPYVPVIQRGLQVPTKDLNLKVCKYGVAYISPVISGFVGADTVGVILSSKIYNEKDLTLAIDIGTNGEIIIGNQKVLAVGSCAAGSALEGAHISSGMRAAAGAIDTLKIKNKSSLRYTENRANDSSKTTTRTNSS